MNRVLYFDLLRFIAIAAVLLLHASSPLMSHFEDDIVVWHVGNVFESITRWCVPVFIMVSGALLLKSKKEEDLGTFFYKRFVKVIIPFIAWIVIFLIYRQYRDDHPIMFPEAIKDAFSDNVYFHLWFLYMIVGLYLVTPIVRTYLANAKRGNIFYFIVLWFLSSFVPVINRLMDMEIHYFFEPVSSFLGYFILGYYLNHFELLKGQRRFIYFLGFLGLMCTIFGTIIVTYNGGEFNAVFYNYIRPNTILVASAIFVFFKNANLDKLPRKTIIVLSNASFGVYLIHPIFRNYLFEQFDLYTNSYLIIPLIALLTLIMSYIVIIPVQKIPGLKKIVP